MQGYFELVPDPEKTKNRTSSTREIFLWSSAILCSFSTTRCISFSCRSAMTSPLLRSWGFVLARAVMFRIFFEALMKKPYVIGWKAFKSSRKPM